MNINQFYSDPAGEIQHTEAPVEGYHTELTDKQKTATLDSGKLAIYGHAELGKVPPVLSKDGTVNEAVTKAKPRYGNKGKGKGKEDAELTKG